MSNSTNGGALVLEVRDLSVTFPTPLGTHVAVKSFGVRIHEGEIVALVGESGSGKSVVARSVMRLLGPPGALSAPTSITISGTDIMSLSEEDLRRVRGTEVTMVLQDSLTTLNPVYKVGDQLVDALRAHERVTSRAAKERAISVLREVRLPAPERAARQYPHELSGGMRQRVALALAVVCHPRLLIADEATTALDVTVQAQILLLLDDLRRDHGTAILFISHDLGVVADISDHVVVMYAGRTVESGPTDAVIAAPQHPYTAALVGAVPRIGQVGRFSTLAGEVPRLLEGATGCCFCSRCTRSTARCSTDEPVLVRSPSGADDVACWNPVPIRGQP